MKTIIHAVHVHAPPGRLFEALTTQRGLSAWWTTKVSVEGGEGGLVSFTFHGDLHPTMRVTQLQEDRLVIWECEGGHANWLRNTFSFSLEPREDDTVLVFRQEYAQELSDEVYGTYNFNWGYYLNSLKHLCEDGRGTPFTPPR